MTRPLISIHDIETDTVIEREMTVEEHADWQETVAKAQADAEAQDIADAELLAGKN